MQFSRYGRPRDKTPPHPQRGVTALRGCLTARSLRTQQRARPAPRRRHRSAPRSVLDWHYRVTDRITRCPQMSCHPGTLARDMALGTGSMSLRQALLRKEVIQPHLPVRLPCYDFVPIADPTFDGSLPQGVRPPASGVTDFRDVTGGVYKARERIHRDVADSRLLATPTSWGRVADPNPN